MIGYQDSHKKYYLTGLFFISLLLRLIFFQLFLVDNPCRLMYDAAHYHGPAVSLAQGKGFTVAEKPYFYRLPGYPLFLAGCYKLFGFDINRALMIQLVLAALIPLLIFFLVQVMFPYLLWVAWLAAGCAAVHPGLLIFSGLVMTETLFLLLFLLFLCLFFFAFKQRNCYWLLMLAGIVLGMATLMRPVGQYVLLLSSGMLLVSRWSWGDKAKKILSLSSGWFVIIAPWLLRNYLLTGYVFFHTLAGPHFMNHAAVRLVMQRQGLSWQEAREQVYGQLKDLVMQEEQIKNRSLIEIEESRLAENLSVTYMRENPGRVLKNAIENMLKTMFSLYSSELLVMDAHGALPGYDQTRTWWEMLKRFLVPQVNNKKIIMVIYVEIILFLFLLLGFLGFFIRLIFYKKSHPEGWLGILFMALFVGLSLSCGFARLRFPGEPFLLIFASIFWIDYFKTMRSLL